MVPHPHSPAIYSNKEHDWPNFFRLVSITAVATFATIGNIFTISSIIIDDLLRRKGNSFLVSATLADLLFTALVLPATSVAILAQSEDSENLCQFQYGLGCMSCVTASVFTAAIGVENLLRLKSLRRIEAIRQQERRRGQPALLSSQIIPPPEKQSMCSQLQVTLLNFTFWVLSAIVVFVHFTLMPHLTQAVCGPSDKPSPDGKLLVNSILVLGGFILFFITLGGVGLLRCVCLMRSWTKPLPYTASREFALINSNFWNWVVRFLIWCPSIVAAVLTQLDKSASTTEYKFMIATSPFPSLPTATTSTNVPSYGTGKTGIEGSDHFLALQRLLFWSAILPSCVGSIVYACANRDFRRCYVQLFNYCCCKTSVTLARRTRDNLRAGNDVRVHIIPGYNIYSSGHNDVAAAPPRFNTFKCGPILNYRRDVYEL